MSELYTIKTEEELRNTANILCDNFAPLIGCKLGKKTWSPPVAYEVCSRLSIKNGMCTNISNNVITKDLNLEGQDVDQGYMTYTFDTFIGYDCKSVSDLVLSYSPFILDTWYFNTVDFDMRLSDTEKFKRTIRTSIVYDSTIFTAAYTNKEIYNSELYPYILSLLLMTYVVRYYLFEYGTEKTSSLNTTVITQAYIDKIINNAQYVKAKLETETQEVGDYEISKDYLRKQLTYLIKNLKQTEYGLIGEFNY